MSYRPNLSQSRADDVWKRFVGMFGGESVSRRFGDAPPAEWVGVVGQLKDYELERGMRRLVRSGKAYVPSLPEFARLCRKVEDDSDEPTKPMLPAPDLYPGDGWTVAANRHLLAHITKRMGVDPKCYGKAPSITMMRNSKAKHAHASPEFVANVELLTKAKNAWASDMRDMSQNGEIPLATQHSIWDDYINKAEAQIARLSGAT